MTNLTAPPAETDQDAANQGSRPTSAADHDLRLQKKKADQGLLTGRAALHPRWITDPTWTTDLPNEHLP